MQWVKTTIICLSLAFPSVCWAQKVSFAYDAAGFRVKRELSIDRSRSAAKSNAKKSALYDSLGDKIVKLNLTPSGEVIVSLENYSENDVCNIHIFDSRGDLMLTNTLNVAVNTIDLNILFLEYTCVASL